MSLTCKQCRYPRPDLDLEHLVQKLMGARAYAAEHPGVYGEAQLSAAALVAALVIQAHAKGLCFNCHDLNVHSKHLPIVNCGACAARRVA